MRCEFETIVALYPCDFDCVPTGPAVAMMPVWGTYNDDGACDHDWCWHHHAVDMMVANNNWDDIEIVPINDHVTSIIVGDEHYVAMG